MPDEPKSISDRLRFYFTDLSFYTRTVLGPDEQRKRQLWLIGCYVAFAAGVFCRQIVILKDFPTVNLDTSRLTPSVLVGSLIVGLAIFPFVVRQVRKLADFLSNDESADPSESSKEGGQSTKTKSQAMWNLMHVFTSFSTGFFVNLVYEKLLEFLRAQLSLGPST